MKLLTLFWCALCVQFSAGDEGYYLNSIAAFDADSNVDLRFPPSVLNDITTASVADAGTTDDAVYITYVGDFSNSGPHLLSAGKANVFVPGLTVDTTFVLSRKIGDLKRIILETSSTDCWLMDSLNVDMYETRYLIAGPNTWLEAVDPTTGVFVGFLFRCQLY